MPESNHLPTTKFYNTATRVGLNILIVFGVVVIISLGRSILIPTIIALLLAAVLGPTAYWMHRRLNFSWWFSCATAVSALVLANVLMTGVLALTIPPFLDFLPNPNNEQDMLEFYNKFRKKLNDAWPGELDKEVFPANPKTVSQIRGFSNLTSYLQSEAPTVLRQLLLYGTSWLWQWVLILVILFFLLLEGGLLIRRVVEIFGPSRETQTNVRTALAHIAHSVKTYLVWRTIINFGLAIVVGTLYHFMGLSQPWTWAVMLAILNYVPYLGPLVAGIPPMFDAFISVGLWPTAVLFGLYTIITLVEGYLVVPVVLGRTLDLNATTIMLACLFWDLVWGTMGLFLAMPLMAGLKAVCYHVPGWRPWANLMSTSQEVPKPVILEEHRQQATAEQAVADEIQLPDPEEEVASQDAN